MHVATQKHICHQPLAYWARIVQTYFCEVLSLIVSRVSMQTIWHIRTLEAMWCVLIIVVCLALCHIERWSLNRNAYSVLDPECRKMLLNYFEERKKRFPKLIQFMTWVSQNHALSLLANTTDWWDGRDSKYTRSTCVVYLVWMMIDLFWGNLNATHVNRDKWLIKYTKMPEQIFRFWYLANWCASCTSFRMHLKGNCWYYFAITGEYMKRNKGFLSILFIST